MIVVPAGLLDRIASPMAREKTRTTRPNDVSRCPSSVDDAAVGMRFERAVVPRTWLIQRNPCKAVGVVP
jgi:hypothetical protein